MALVTLRSTSVLFLVLYLAAASAWADHPVAKAATPAGRADAKARKTWNEAIEWERRHAYDSAIGSYRKANQQDGGHCAECLQRAYALALQTGASKDAEAIARDMLANAATPEEKGVAHYRIALAIQRQGMKNKKEKCFTESCEEFHAVLDLRPDVKAAHYSLGVSLAYLHKDDEARHEFSTYVAEEKSPTLMRVRAERFLTNIDLARAKMAPPFTVTTLDGQHVSLDALAGKVVLIDFWATWCGPCREALPDLKRLAQKFAGQPLVILSVSLDKDEAKWKEFVARNNMSWLQYRDGGWEGPMSTQFDVRAIPATFTVDADGVLEDQHVGDADIERKLKKLVAHAAEVANRKPVEAAADPGPGTN
ncbi:MAG TPA: TlpA family protein disulfide reductase [Terracidiphilus sp.]|jgi:thiol-disulfide isomerase/thioredoxin|nr:TlpA family protein disulfide reductase [Terracidiphilus sp.]